MHWKNPQKKAAHTHITLLYGVQIAIDGAVTKYHEHDVIDYVSRVTARRNVHAMWVNALEELKVDERPLVGAKVKLPQFISDNGATYQAPEHVQAFLCVKRRENYTVMSLIVMYT